MRLFSRNDQNIATDQRNGGHLRLATLSGGLLVVMLIAILIIGLSRGATPAKAAGDYTQGVTPLSSTQAKIWFTPTIPVALVDVHYLVNGTNQQNFRMTNNGGTWTQTVSGLAAGNVIKYAFTYQNSAGQGTDTGWWSFTFTGAAGGPTATPQPTSGPTATPIPTSGPTATLPAGGNGTFPLTFQNNTRGLKANSQIYVLIFLMNAQGQWCHLTASGAVVPVNPNDANAANHLTKNGVNYANYAFTLAQASTITMPTRITGGRVYLSVGSPLFIPIYTNGWGGPDLNNPSDPNIDVVYDWYELAYVYQQTAFGGNTTQVDMFGFPMTVRLQQAAIGYDRTVGITLTRDQVFAQYTAAVGPVFQPLETPARIVAPRSAAAFAPGGAQGNYMQPLIDQMWSQYAATPFVLHRLGDTFSGQVINGRFQFTKNGAGPYFIDKPTSTNVFACSGTLASGSDIEKDLEAQFCAALNRGVALNTASWGNPATYYTSNPKNDYAQFFHQISLGNLAYGFPYDDVNNQSSVAILPNANPPSNLTISIGW